MNDNIIELSIKQAEYIRDANRRWNGKVGATQCGKTYVDTLYVIPNRIVERTNLKGLNFIVGVSKETITRNIIEPLQELFGDAVTDINSNNIAYILGEKVYCVGADNVGRVRKFRGARIKYLYIDEIYDINKEVFELLKSRLSFEYSCCDFAGNPQQPSHHIEKFINSDVDVYYQRYTLFENPFLKKNVVNNLCKEYEGTIYYQRYILGIACYAEGLIYRKFADKPNKYKMKYLNDYENGVWHDNLPRGETIIGIDYGGTKSGQSFTCTRISYDYRKVVVMATRRITERLDDEELLKEQLNFIEYCMKKFHTKIDYIYPDNESSTHIRSLDNAVEKRGWDIIVRGSWKKPILDRIDIQNKMLSYDIFFYLEDECDSLVNALKEALWNDKVKSAENKDERLDDFTTDIDSLDSYEYTIERYIKQIIDAIDMEGNYV